MSGVSSRSARISPAAASICPERRSPPRGPGRSVPFSRASARQRLTLAALTPNRSAASRWLAPASTAARTRMRRSTERALDMPAGLLSGRQFESEPECGGNSNRFKQLGLRSNQRGQQQPGTDPGEGGASAEAPLSSYRAQRVQTPAAIRLAPRVAPFDGAAAHLAVIGQSPGQLARDALTLDKPEHQGRRSIAVAAAALPIVQLADGGRRLRPPSRKPRDRTSGHRRSVADLALPARTPYEDGR